MDDWQIVLLHTKKTTLLKRAFEAAFPGRVISLHVPDLGARSKAYAKKEDLVRYFRRHVFDPGVWRHRVLTVYGDGDFHHYTYALTKLALERRGMGSWTYFHFDQHRDDWGDRGGDGYADSLDCASFVDQIAHDHSATPFLVGPDAYAKRDSEGYTIRDKHIPIYHNFFTKELQRSQRWLNNGIQFEGKQTGVELPAVPDLRATPAESYLSFDLDLLARSEIVTNFDQNDHATVRRLCQILDHIRPHKRVFSADILGFPDWNKHHALSCLTMVILARKIMGLGVDRLLNHHTRAKKIQAAWFAGGALNKYQMPRYDPFEEGRESPIVEGELMEILKWTR